MVTDLEKQRIRDRIHQFDIAALLRLLREWGYREKDIYFRSNPSLVSPGSLCEEILFLDAPDPPVVIVINVGLLCGTTPLPSFFRKKMENGSIDPELFSRFLAFFDHFLLRNLLMPDRVLLPRPEAYLNLIGLSSVSSLSHLFQLCFPELKVEVFKISRLSHTQRESIALGRAFLGKDSFLGKKREHSISSVKVVFTAVDGEASLSCAEEIMERTHVLLFPLLLKIDVFLVMTLVIQHQRNSAQLSPSSYLGHVCLGKEPQSFEIPLFSDYACKMSSLR